MEVREKEQSALVLLYLQEKYRTYHDCVRFSAIISVPT